MPIKQSRKAKCECKGRFSSTSWPGPETQVDLLQTLVARLSLFRDPPTVVFLEFSKCGDRGVCDAVVPRFKHPHAIAAPTQPLRGASCNAGKGSSLWVDLAG
jgi:hypothetical protein